MKQVNGKVTGDTTQSRVALWRRQTLNTWQLAEEALVSQKFTEKRVCVSVPACKHKYILAKEKGKEEDQNTDYFNSGGVNA